MSNLTYIHELTISTASNGETKTLLFKDLKKAVKAMINFSDEKLYSYHTTTLKTYNIVGDLDLLVNHHKYGRAFTDIRFYSDSYDTKAIITSKVLW